MACRGGDWKKIPKIQVEIRETENLKCIMMMKVHSGQPKGATNFEIQDS